ncbi:30S ribosomal protein THX [Spirosoma soli]|uniref:30S ribosomal protein THX n=1 Tax=Spirosoma soli TaxID=1770529 RepID=A0ABW5M2C5_9BACT
MGKGDKKSRRGKISMGSYGKTRPSSSKPSTAPKPEAKPES